MNTLKTCPPRALEFKPRCEVCHKDLKVCRCDSFVGLCSPCGTPVYGGDDYRVDQVQGEPVYVCPLCVEEEKGWKISAISSTQYEREAA